MFVAKRWRRSKRATKNGKPETLGKLGTRYIANTKRKEKKNGQHGHILLCFCFVFLRLVYPMLSVSLDFPFLIAPSVFSNVYFAYCSEPNTP
jgi:hypothetical protein